ncbi:hypothetical protein [Arthrobacter sp. 08Y14]|uniref:hypothetical protein n=1 Tax=Arthrobacter sp. 08Y14 TaxID=2058885 RepID=UPI000CE3BECD|nr:hypothetical protein [Arthrobacter sp. 08Y14]
MRPNTPIAKTLFIISTVAAIVILTYLWVQFDNTSPVIKVFFSLFVVGIISFNARRAFSTRKP